jgi:DNA segregation ATPase FtsK/SpoIIIE, S-DNA-T family
MVLGNKRLYLHTFYSLLTHFETSLKHAKIGVLKNRVLPVIFSLFSMLMARLSKKSKKKKKKNKDDEGFSLSSETKRGIIAVFLLAFTALVILAFFQSAGSLGVLINNGLAFLFGWDRFIIPLFLLILAATALFPERGRFSFWNHLGTLLFFLSFNGLLHLLLLWSLDASQQNVSEAGGVIGTILGNLIPGFAGFWGGLIILFAILTVAFMLIFNISIRQLIDAPQTVSEWLGQIKHFGGSDEEEDWDEDEEEEEEEWEEEEEEDEEDEGLIIDDTDEMEELEVEEAETEEKFSKRKVKEKKKKKRLKKYAGIPLQLMDLSTSRASSGDVERNKEMIQKTFEHFGINVEMGDTATGPTVTQYTLRPARGIKLSRILGLQNDLALALAAHPIRIEAPIPGKSLVGIEVPNQKIATVTLRDLLESKSFKRRKTPTTVPLGKDVSGKTWIAPVEKMPHMLIAGATGSGKSVCLNTLIVSLMYQNSPEDLRFILVDPKRVELNVYEGVPHLLVPPITKVEDTVNALKWAVREMERRLDLLAKFKARDINSYNEKAEERLPKIVIAIDELADLMSNSGREVEAAIVRIAQMARAVGIHLILATQRPSVDVITGLIKANIPTRLAFAVASQTDTRTILDCAGADKLLGRGDMLYTSAETSKPKRLQGAFLSEEEIQDIVKHLKREDLADYNHAVTEGTGSTSVFGDADEDSDPLIEDAIQAILQSDRASTSFLQRRLRVGYARAARMMDILEQMGIIGEGQGAKPRDILITEWPPSGNLKEGMPTAQDDYEEAGYENDEEKTEELEDEDEVFEIDDEENEEAEEEEIEEEEYEEVEEEEEEVEELEEEEEYEEAEEEGDYEDSQEGDYLDDEDEDEEIF